MNFPPTPVSINPSSTITMVMTFENQLAQIVYTTDDGLEILIEDFGGNGDNLIITHATGFCARMYLPMAIALRRNYHCYGINARHHGGSTGNLDFSWTTYAEDILGSLPQLSDGIWNGFGHSYGASALLLAEQMRPGTFHSLFLYEAVIPMEAPKSAPDYENPLSVLTKRRRQSFSTRKEAEANFSAKKPMAKFEPLIRDLYYETGLRRELDGDLHLSCSSEYESEIYAYASCHDAYNQLGIVRSRVFFFAGGTTHDFNIDYQRKLVKCTPNSSSHEVENIGHFGPFENPTKVADTILNAPDSLFKTKDSVKSTLISDN